MSVADEPVILVDRPRAGLAVVTLNRPRSMNALSRALRSAFCRTMEALARDSEVQVVIITGAGRAFCAGLDLKELGDSEEGLAGFDGKDSFVDAVRGFAGPVIAAVNGPAMTGGFEIVLACDVILAGEKAVFADTHGRVGVIPGGALSQRLSRAVGVYRAKHMSLSGNPIDAQTAAAWGLVSEVVPTEQLLPRAVALATDMLEIEPAMSRALKKLIDDGYDLPLGEGLALELRTARSANPAVRGAQIADRRDAVIGRGRALKPGG